MYYLQLVFASIVLAFISATLVVPLGRSRKSKTVVFAIERGESPTKLQHLIKDKPPIGPTGLPFVGNVWEFFGLRSKPDQILRELATRYGSMVSLRLGATPVVVINCPKIAKDLLDKRGATYSTRPSHRLFLESWRLLTLPTGDLFRRLRRLYQALLAPQEAAKLRGYQDFESKVLLLSLLNEHSHFLEHVQRYASSVVFSFCYGVRLSRRDHPLAGEFYGIWATLTRYAQPGTLLIDFIPFLQYLPLWAQFWRHLAVRLRDREDALHMAFFRRIKQRLEDGTAPASFAASLLKTQKEEGITDSQACDIMAMLCGAGSDTTAAYLQTFFKVMALHPAVVSKAQAELDAVVGPARLPSWDDRASLPYIRALIKELHRWAPSSSMGIAHATTKDDEYNGLAIPAGTIILPALNSLSRDPGVYPEPDLFEPGRFLNHQLDSQAAAVHSDPAARDHYHYGFGRRLCPGIHVADASLFISVSRILWGFDIKHAPGQSPLDMDDRITGLVRKPKPYSVCIDPRSPAHAEIIRSEAAALKTDLLDFDDVEL